MTYRMSRCIAIAVTDLKKAEHFYTEVLGFKKKSNTPDGLELDADPIRIFLDQSTRHLVKHELVVEDIAAAQAHLEQNGCVRATDIEGCGAADQEVFMRDPFGMIFHLEKE